MMFSTSAVLLLEDWSISDVLMLLFGVTGVWVHPSTWHEFRCVFKFSFLVITRNLFQRPDITSLFSWNHKIIFLILSDSVCTERSQWRGSLHWFRFGVTHSFQSSQYLVKCEIRKKTWTPEAGWNIGSLQAGHTSSGSSGLERPAHRAHQDSFLQGLEHEGRPQFPSEITTTSLRLDTAVRSAVCCHHPFRGGSAGRRAGPPSSARWKPTIRASSAHQHHGRFGTEVKLGRSSVEQPKTSQRKQRGAAFGWGYMWPAWLRHVVTL